MDFEEFVFYTLDMQSEGKTYKTFPLSSLTVKLPFYLALFCTILILANGTLGYRVFMHLFEKQYRAVTEQIANTALSYIDADRITSYAQGAPADEAWMESDRMLDALTVSAQLVYIYVTIPDEKYESRVYVFDTVHPQVVNGKKYPLGQVNSLLKYDDDYIENLRRVMEHGEPYIRFVYNERGGHVTTSVPVIDSHGKTVAIMSIVKPMSEVSEFKESYRRSVTINSSVITGIFVVIFIIILLFRVVRPVSMITHETAHFAEHGGKISNKLSRIKGRDELGILARSVEKMSVDMNSYIDVLTRTTAEKERLSAELDVATQIQANMLPRIFPPYADHPELELYASMEPAKEVGGDFYDFFVIDDDHFAVVVGDVSGKGVPAALFMVVAKTLLKNVAMQGFGPAEIFTMVNAQLCEGNDAGLFVTCWLGILTISTGELKFANAGHTSPVLRHENKCEFLVSKPDLMLAAMEGIKYSEHSLQFNGGDSIFLYTDGITEAVNGKEELYGEERLLSCLKNSDCMNSRELLKAVRADIDRFTDGTPQFDDITMLEFKLKNGE